MSGGHVGTPPWNNFAKLTSVAGSSFQSFAKSTEFGAGELLKLDILLEFDIRLNL